MEKLFIAIDPGFDSLKIAANGKLFKIPFSVQETDERKLTDYGLRPDFLLYRDSAGATYRVGAYARELIFEHKSQAEIDQQMDGFYTEERFTSQEFLVGLRVAIALAMDANGFSRGQDLELFVMVALPHAVRQKYAAAVIGTVSGPHRYAMTHGEGPEKDYQFTIQEDHVFTVSQTIAAIIGETSDDEGNINQDKFFYLTQGPTLVVDGGYYTTGLVSVSRGGSVDDNMTESDTNHAMKNVNIAIADAVKDRRSDIRHYVMEYLIQNSSNLRYIENGRAETIDLKQVRAEKAKEVCASLINHINEKYNNLLDYNYVMVTGGTGAVFYQQMLEYYTEAGIFDQDHFLLANSELNGERYSIEFSIVIGAYKGLMGVKERVG